MDLFVVPNVAGDATDYLHGWDSMHVSALLATILAAAVLVCLVVVGVVVGAAPKDDDRVFSLT